MICATLVDHSPDFYILTPVILKSWDKHQLQNPGLVAFHDIQPVKPTSQFLQPRSSYRATSEWTVIKTVWICTDRGARSTEVLSDQHRPSSDHSSVRHTNYNIFRSVQTVSFHVSPVDWTVGCSPSSRQWSAHIRSPHGYVARTTSHSWCSSDTPVLGCRRRKCSWYIGLDTDRSGLRCEPDPTVCRDILSTVHTDNIIHLTTLQRPTQPHPSSHVGEIQWENLREVRGVICFL